MVNSGDAPDLKNAREDAATIADTFKHTVIIADPAMLKGRRYGNMIMAGSDLPFDDDPDGAAPAGRRGARPHLERCQGPRLRCPSTGPPRPRDLSPRRRRCSVTALLAA